MIERVKVTSCKKIGQIALIDLFVVVGMCREGIYKRLLETEALIIPAHELKEHVPKDIKTAGIEPAISSLEAKRATRCSMFVCSSRKSALKRVYPNSL